MNTDPKNNEPVQGLQLHPEQTSPNTKPRRLYEITVEKTTFFNARFRVEAASEDEAHDIAWDLIEEQNWEIESSEYDFVSIDLVDEEGGRHE